MAIKAVKAELRKSLDAYLTAAVGSSYKMGLFKNNLTVSDDTVIGDIVPADFGGYSGLQNLTSFSASVWTAPRAVATSADITWTADGTSSNTIYGYYVVDGTGALAWIDKNASGPLTIGSPGQRYVVSPAYSRRSEF